MSVASEEVVVACMKLYVHTLVRPTEFAVLDWLKASCEITICVDKSFIDSCMRVDRLQLATPRGFSKESK